MSNPDNITTNRYKQVFFVIESSTVSGLGNRFSDIKSIFFDSVGAAQSNYRSFSSVPSAPIPEGETRELRIGTGILDTFKNELVYPPDSVHKTTSTTLAQSSNSGFISLYDNAVASLNAAYINDASNNSFNEVSPPFVPDGGGGNSSVNTTNDPGLANRVRDYNLNNPLGNHDADKDNIINMNDSDWLKTKAGQEYLASMSDVPPGGTLPPDPPPAGPSPEDEQLIFDQAKSSAVAKARDGDLGALAAFNKQYGVSTSPYRLVKGSGPAVYFEHTIEGQKTKFHVTGAAADQLKAAGVWMEPTTVSDAEINGMRSGYKVTAAKDLFAIDETHIVKDYILVRGDGPVKGDQSLQGNGGAVFAIDRNGMKMHVTGAVRDKWLAEGLSRDKWASSIVTLDQKGLDQQALSAAIDGGGSPDEATKYLEQLLAASGLNDTRKKAVRDWFATHDINGDGYVDGTENKNALSVVSTEARKDGKIDYNESIAKNVYEQKVDTMLAGSGLDADQQGLVRQWFKDKDTNRDGVVDASEAPDAFAAAKTVGYREDGTISVADSIQINNGRVAKEFTQDGDLRISNKPISLVDPATEPALAGDSGIGNPSKNSNVANEGVDWGGEPEFESPAPVQKPRVGAINGPATVSGTPSEGGSVSAPGDIDAEIDPEDVKRARPEIDDRVTGERPSIVDRLNSIVNANVPKNQLSPENEELLAQSGLSADKQQMLRDWYAQNDKNKDGVVQQSEAPAAFAAPRAADYITDGELTVADNIKIHGGSLPKHVLSRADRAAIANSGLSEADQKKINQWFADYDTNNDGYVTKSERAGIFTDPSLKQYTEDGKISVTESVMRNGGNIHSAPREEAPTEETLVVANTAADSEASSDTPTETRANPASPDLPEQANEIAEEASSTAGESPADAGRGRNESVSNNDNSQRQDSDAPTSEETPDSTEGEIVEGQSGEIIEPQETGGDSVAQDAQESTPDTSAQSSETDSSESLTAASGSAGGVTVSSSPTPGTTVNDTSTTTTDDQSLAATSGPAPASYVRDTTDSGFKYPWSAARSAGVSDVPATLEKAVGFMNKAEKKMYVYDKQKGTIRSKDGRFITRDDIQSLNNIILKYSKNNFAPPGNVQDGMHSASGTQMGATASVSEVGRVGTTPIVAQAGDGMARIDNSAITGNRAPLAAAGQSVVNRTTDSLGNIGGVQP